VLWVLLMLGDLVDNDISQLRREIKQSVLPFGGLQEFILVDVQALHFFVIPSLEIFVIQEVKQCPHI